MDDTNVFTTILFAAIAGAYSWGMRGRIVGGERGALLPGALLGLTVSSLFGFEYWQLFAAVGAFAMFHGGSCTYGEVLHIFFNSNKGEEYEGRFIKQMAAAFINGGNWFGLAAYYLALTSAFLQGKYKISEVIIQILAIPFIQILGEQLFNRPFNPKLSQFPRIYFSIKRREEWGGNLLLCFLLFLFALFKKDFISSFAVLAGYFSGGSGFALGQFIFKINREKHSGRYIFGKLEEEGYISNWKIMEFTLGAVGFAGTVLYFSLVAGKSHILPFIDKKQYIPSALGYVLVFLCIVLYLVLVIYSESYEKKNSIKFDDHLFDIIIRPLFASVPIMFVLLGNEKTAVFYTVFFILFVCCEKCLYSFFRGVYSETISKAIICIICSAITIAFIVKEALSIQVIVAITLTYTLASAYKAFNPAESDKREASGKGFAEYYLSNIPVEGFFIITNTLLVFLFNKI